MVKVRTGLVFISSAGVHVVHQYVFVFSVQFEDARPLHGCLSGVSVQILEVLFPLSFQAFRGGLLDAVLDFLAVLVFGIAFIEKVVGTVFFDDVVVYAAVFGREKLFRIAFKAREVLVGVCVISDEAFAVVALQGKINHIFFGLAVVNGLRSPYPISITEMFRIIFGQIDFGVFPMQQIVRTQEYDARVFVPTVFGGIHVRGYDVKASVFTAQDVRVADTAAFADGVGSDDGAVFVKRTPVHSIVAEGKTQVFLLLGISSSLEIGEEVSFKISRSFSLIWCRLSVAHGCS